MALAPESFLSPAGLVERIFFPSDTLPELKVRLAGYLAAGATVLNGAGGDDALASYVYWRVFDAVYIRLAVRPAKVTKQAEGSTEFLLTQINAIKEKADEYKAQWEAVLPVPIASQAAPPTQTLRVTFLP